MQSAIEANRSYVCGETLADKLHFVEQLADASTEVELGDDKVKLVVERVS